MHQRNIILTISSETERISMRKICGKVVICSVATACRIANTKSEIKQNNCLQERVLRHFIRCSDGSRSQLIRKLVARCKNTSYYK